MAKKKKTTKKTIAPIPIASVRELEKSLARLGTVQRRKREMEADASNEISVLQERLAERVSSVDDEIRALSLGIKDFVQEKRGELIPTGKKSAKLATGTIQFRDIPASVKTRSTPKLLERIMEEHNILQSFHRFSFRMARFFLRVKIELNKESILKNPIRARKFGLEVKAGEERLYLLPNETETEIAC